MPRADASRRRCAIYTRKSSEEGLEQEFNSLAAQCEACEAFIRSQRSEGWVLVRTRYDDGGFSGGNLERPALQHLIADIRAGRIDIVVVYKVDRLTRSLADFARLVELFDAEAVSFRLGDAAIQHDELYGTAHAQCAVVLCPVRAGGHRRNASATRSPPRKRRACGWAAMSRWAMTRAGVRSSSTRPRPRPCVASSLSIVSSAACAGSRRRPTVSGFGRNAAQRRMAPSAAANPSRAVISTPCSRTQFTPAR